MLKNYFKIAWRNLIKSKLFSFINIAGLTIGLTCCMLITLYVYHELSYDSYHKNLKQLYQLGTIFVKQGKEERKAITPAPMAKLMQQEFPEIAKTTRLLRTFLDDKTLLQYRGTDGELKSFYETNGYLADSTFFDVLTYQFREGNPSTALQEPNCVVLSEEIARKFFGNKPALNKVIHISSSTNGDFDFRITGVFTPAETPSHIDGRFFMSMAGGNMANYISQRTDLATNNMFYTYLLLRPDADPEKLEQKFPAFIDKYAGKDLKAMGFYKKQFLTAVKQIHLSSQTSDNVTPGGSVAYLYVLGSIALFTLLIACINFMNLSTARSSKRSAEVGVRKVLGADKASLVRQFLSESLLMAGLAFVVALLVTGLALPLFSKLSGQTIHFYVGKQGWLICVFFALALVTGLLAGSYPAFYLSSFKPVKVLKGRVTNSLAAISLRKGLVVFQFVISVVLIVASVVIVNQMKYMRSKDLGFEKDQQIIIPLRSNIAKGIYTPLKDELSRKSFISSVGAAQYYPGIFHPSDMLLYREGLSMQEAKRVYQNYVDENYLPTLGIKPIAGRIYAKEFIASDTSNADPVMVLNEEAVKQLGFLSPQETIGKHVKVDISGRTYQIRVLGVVKDFHFKDLHTAIEPYGFQLNTGGTYSYLIAHAHAKEIGTALQEIAAVWHRLNKNEPFEWSFLDEDFQKNYEAGNRLASIVSYFTIIAILISCMGLFGLSLFSTEQRTKEIGIRKVLGATAVNIVALLSKDFVKLVLIAIVIALPLAWMAMQKWLQDFAYRIPIDWVILTVTAGIALAIALITVSFQALRAAFSNPVKSLRTE
ncbi:MAG: ABC transporter permease [Williamsia sp.]|nr:ABC transporter permease [Williamsia sp.]